MRTYEPRQDVGEDVERALNGVHSVLHAGDPLVHDVLATVDVRQYLVHAVLGLEGRE